MSATPPARRAALGALLLAACAVGVEAQAPITAVGLGYRVDPIDGRAAALGGTGIGLLGGSFSIRNPADLTQHEHPGFGLSFSGESVTLRSDGGDLDTGRERFTTIRALVPFSDWAASVAFGGAFDQDWAARFRDTLLLADGRVPFEEAREHDGGISAIDVSLARRFGALSVGISGQRLTGSLRQSFVRTFEAPLDGAPALANTAGAQSVSYGAWRLRGGATLAVGERLLFSAVVGHGGKLEAESTDSVVVLAEVDLPTTFEAGASARLTDRVLVTAAGGWVGWAVAGDLSDASSHDVTWYGGGVEYDGLSLLGGELPVRLGARRADLPFSMGSEPIGERAVTGGFGWIFRQGQAAVDLGFEFGSRGDLDSDGLEESFRRLTLSFTLRQIGF